MTIKRPPRASIDGFEDRKWKEAIADGVDKLQGVRLDGTVTPIATTGNQTINKPCGVVNFAGGATSLTVTNSLVTSASLVFASVLTNDATAVLKNTECSAGSFVIRMSTAPTGATKVGFLVVRAQ